MEIDYDKKMVSDITFSVFKRKSRKKICIIIAVFIVAGVVLGLIIWGATKK